MQSQGIKMTQCKWGHQIRYWHDSDNALLCTIIKCYVNIKILIMELYTIIYIGQKLVKNRKFDIEVFKTLIHTIIRYSVACTRKTLSTFFLYPR